MGSSATSHHRPCVMSLCRPKSLNSCTVANTEVPTLQGQVQGTATWLAAYWKREPVPVFVGAPRKSPLPHSDSWPGRALLALHPSASCKSIKPAKYILLLPREKYEIFYTNQE